MAKWKACTYKITNFSTADCFKSSMLGLIIKIYYLGIDSVPSLEDLRLIPAEIWAIL